MKKRYTLFVVPQGGGRIRSLILPGLLIRILPFLFIISILIVSGIIYDYSRIKWNAAEVYQLRNENRNQRIEIMTLANKLRDLENQIASLKIFDRKLRIIANLEKKEEPGQFLGIGGPSPEDKLSLLTDNGRKEAFLKDLNIRLDTLKEEALKQEKSFGELHEYFVGQKRLLASTPSIWPVKGWVTSDFGYRISPFTGLKEFHEGIDIATRIGTPVISPANGVVTEIGMDRGLGRYLVITHGYGFKTKYGHLSEVIVKKGEKVKRGTKIAKVGNTGRSTGPHLHYEVFVKNVAVDPMNYILN